jgi:hypothetical protein
MWIHRVLLVISITLSSAYVVHAQTSDDDAAIREVVDTYVTGWRAGDVEKLKSIFELDHGYIIWHQGDDGDPIINSRTFAKLMENRRPNPTYGQPYEILSIDVIDGRLATAKFAVQRKQGYYIDLFTLINAKGFWKVVTKQFSWHPGETWKLRD